MSDYLGDTENQKPVNTWKLGTGVDHQQMGNTWSGDKDIVSLSLSGDMNIFDQRVGDKPARVLGVSFFLPPGAQTALLTSFRQATQKSITSIASSGTDTFLAGNADGRVLWFSPSSSESINLQGTGHSNLVSGLAPSPNGDTVFSTGYDDRVREIQVNGSTSEFLQVFICLGFVMGHLYATLVCFSSTALSTAAQPRSVAVTEDGTVFVAEVGNVEAFRANQRVLHEVPKYQPSAMAGSRNFVAIGGEVSGIFDDQIFAYSQNPQDQKVRLAQWDGISLKDLGVLEGNKGVISALAFSPDGNLLASGDVRILVEQ